MSVSSVDISSPEESKAQALHRAAREASFLNGLPEWPHFLFLDQAILVRHKATQTGSRGHRMVELSAYLLVPVERTHYHHRKFIELTLHVG